MAYSRWSNSCWYTYADVNGGFTICGEKNFSDEELKEHGDKAADRFIGSYTQEEVNELKEYINLYIKEYLK